MILKSHEFRELVNDIRLLTELNVKYEHNTQLLFYILSRHHCLQNLSCNDVHEVWMECVKYKNAQHLRARIVTVLHEIGIYTDKEVEARQLELAKTAFKMAVSLKGKSDGSGQ